MRSVDDENAAILIKTLWEAPSALDTVAGWVQGQWGLFSGRTLAQTRNRFAAELGPDREAPLPRTLVAWIGDGPVGVLSLREHDSTDFDPAARPWICNVFVPEAWRGAGIARSLCLRSELEARRLGYARLYLASPQGENSLYGALGYRTYQNYEDPRGHQYLMSKTLPTSRS